ncbi:Hypothetical predicted protein, partial [Mytilus galloprovincialis]
KIDMNKRFPLRLIALLVTFHVAVCQDEQTDGLGHVSGSEYARVTSHITVPLIVVVAITATETYRNRGPSLNIEIERLTIEKRRLEIVENKLAFSVA